MVCFVLLQIKLGKPLNQYSDTLAPASAIDLDFDTEGKSQAVTDTLN